MLPPFDLDDEVLDDVRIADPAVEEFEPGLSLDEMLGRIVRDIGQASALAILRQAIQIVEAMESTPAKPKPASVPPLARPSRTKPPHQAKPFHRRSVRGVVIPKREKGPWPRKLAS